MNTSFSVTVITELNLQFVALQVEVANTRKGATKKVMSARLGLVYTACRLEFRLCFCVYWWCFVMGSST